MVVFHSILCIASAWALKRISSSEETIANKCFLFIFGHSIIGILFYNSNRFREDITIEISTCLAETIPHPLINAQLYTTLGYKEFGYIHTLTAFLPIGFKFYYGNVENELINLLQTLNMISSIYLSVQEDNGWCCLIAINQLIFNRTFHHFDEDKLDCIAIGLSFFTIAAVRAIESLKKINL